MRSGEGAPCSPQLSPENRPLQGTVALLRSLLVGAACGLIQSAGRTWALPRAAPCSPQWRFSPQGPPAAGPSTLQPLLSTTVSSRCHAGLVAPEVPS